MRYFIYLSYDGSNYHGWQIQPNGNSVQETLQHALSTLLRGDIPVVGAGRTDAGVNATEMVAHFDTNIPIDCIATVKRLNRFLPQDIGIENIVRVSDEAHARFSALARTYKYYVITGKSPMLRHFAYRYPTPLDFTKMNEACRHLYDFTDFTSFSKLHTDTKTNNCKVMHAEWKRVTNDTMLSHHSTVVELWEFTVQADRFLRNMVRAIVGTLIEVGRGTISIDEFCEIIEKKDRCSAGTSVPGNALFLSKIDYPDDIFVIDGPPLQVSSQ